MVDAPTFAQLYNERNDKIGQSPRYTAEEIQKFSDGSDPILYPNTDWFKEIIKPASLQHKYNLSFGGGTNVVAYFVSLGAVTQDGIYRESATRYDQLNLRSNTDVNVTSGFKVEWTCRHGYKTNTILHTPVMNTVFFIGPGTDFLPRLLIIPMDCLPGEATRSHWSAIAPDTIKPACSA